MAKENETIADIIAEKRREANYIVQVSQGKCQTRRDKAEDEARDIRREADRLEAAHKREVDALKQRCAELNAEVAAKDEVIKRLDAEIRKYREERELRIAAQKAKAAAEGYADGKRDAQVGDCAKLREALETLLNLAYEVQDANSEYGPKICIPAQFIIDEVKSALATPPRNCEVGTAEEQSERFDKFCHANINPQGCCGDCPAFRTTRDDCELVWAQLPYEAKEGGAK